MAKWNTVKDNKGNTFVSAGGTLWPTIGGGGASLSYGSSGNSSSSSSTVNVASAPSVSAPAATESSGNDWYSEA